MFLCSWQVHEWTAQSCCFLRTQNTVYQLVVKHLFFFGEVRSLQTHTGKMQINRDLHLFYLMTAKLTKLWGSTTELEGDGMKRSQCHKHIQFWISEGVAPSQKDKYDDGEYHYPFSVNEWLGCERSSIAMQKLTFCEVKAKVSELYPFHPNFQTITMVSVRDMPQSCQALKKGCLKTLKQPSYTYWYIWERLGKNPRILPSYELKLPNSY